MHLNYADEALFVCVSALLWRPQVPRQLLVVLHGMLPSAYCSQSYGGSTNGCASVYVYVAEPTSATCYTIQGPRDALTFGYRVWVSKDYITLFCLRFIGQHGVRRASPLATGVALWHGYVTIVQQNGGQVCSLGVVGSEETTILSNGSRAMSPHGKTSL